MKHLKSALLISLAVLSTFALTGFIKPAESTQEGTPAAYPWGTHYIYFNYYATALAYDHDMDIFGTDLGEWHFKLGVNGAEKRSSGEVLVDKDRNGWKTVNHVDLTWTHYMTSTYYTLFAGEADPPWFGWDYSRSYTRTIPSNWGYYAAYKPNTYHYENYKTGDVWFYYQYYIYNYRPTISSISGPPTYIGYRKIAYTWSATGSDPEGDSLTYYWYVDGVLKKTGSSSFTYTFPTSAALGKHTIMVKARDYFGLYSYEKTSDFYIYNRFPTVGVVSGPSTGYPGIFYTYSTTGSDPDGDSITYEWSVNGVIQPSTGPTLTRAFAAGTYTVRVRTKDSYGFYSGFSSKTVTIIATYIKIWADKTSYKIGEKMRVYLSVRNPGPAMSVRVKINLRLPDASLHPLLNLVVTLPAGYDSGDVLWQSFTIPKAPFGNYAWIAELRDPTTNALIIQSTWNWMLSF